VSAARGPAASAGDASAAAHPAASSAAAEQAAVRVLRARVERVRARLQWIVRGRVALSAAAAGAGTVAGLLLVARATGFATGAAVWRAAGETAPLVLAALLGAMSALLTWRLVGARQPRVSTVRAALWLEERAPCGHALVTLVSHEAGRLPAAVEARLGRQVASASDASGRWLSDARRRAWRGPGLLTAVAAAALLGTLRWPTAHGASPGAAGGGAPAPFGGERLQRSRLAGWRVEVTPPAYTRRAARLLPDTGTVAALPGSRVRLSGPGAATGLVAAWIVPGDAVAPADVAVRSASGRWMAEFVVPARPAALRLADAAAGTDRTLTLLPQPDSLPVVQLLLPARDVVQRDSTGPLALAALARDDVGLGEVRFELLVTSGAGERFTARTVVLGARPLAGAARDSFAARLTLESLGLVAGDVVHLRAVARDRHPAAGREAGVSETRSLRIARADEYDSVAVEAAPPPPVDSSLLSQRMLLLLTERLEARRPRLARATVVTESRALAVEQGRIRRRVSAIVFQRLSGDGDAEHVHSEGDGHDHGLVLEAGRLVPSTAGGPGFVMPGASPPASLAPPTDPAGGESPVVGINRPLLEAYNHMWEAGRALELGEPGAAIPPMRRALEAIQRARAAERVYLRGRVRPIVVDLARVRLAGRDTGQGSTRRPGEALPSREAAWDARLRAAAMRLTVDATAGRDSLLALRLDLLGERGEVADALAHVLDGLRAGGDVSGALARARLALAPPRRGEVQPAWGVP
jgi:hypothetical protein